MTDGSQHVHQFWPFEKISKQQNTWTMLNNVLLTCVRDNLCDKITLLPELMCNNHDKINTEGKLRTERAMSKFSRETDKIWPPSHRDFSKPTNILGRPALLVIFDATNTKACATCLVHHTEGFFSHEVKKDRFGYVWMRQNLVYLLRSCLSEHSCSELRWDETFQQLMITDDMRPLSLMDLEDSNKLIVG